MDVKELMRLRPPRLYHMAESGSWDSIRKHGLLSTSAMLDWFEYTGDKRFKIESQWRPKSVPIIHPVHGKAIVRDQAPMSPDDLSICLTGISIQEWYELINSKIFFWVSRDRLFNFLNAVNYRERSHTVITLSTQDLLRAYLDDITLTDINTGFAYHGGTRGRHTFKTIDEFPSSRKVWELAVEYAVRNVIGFTIAVKERKRDRLLKVIWKR